MRPVWSVMRRILSAHLVATSSKPPSLASLLIRKRSPARAVKEMRTSMIGWPMLKKILEFKGFET